MAFETAALRDEWVSKLTGIPAAAAAVLTAQQRVDFLLPSKHLALLRKEERKVAAKDAAEAERKVAAKAAAEAERKVAAKAAAEADRKAAAKAGRHQHKPPTPIDRTRMCPFLIRCFYSK